MLTTTREPLIEVPCHGCEGLRCPFCGGEGTLNARSVELDRDCCDACRRAWHALRGWSEEEEQVYTAR